MNVWRERERESGRVGEQAGVGERERACAFALCAVVVAFFEGRALSCCLCV